MSEMSNGELGRLLADLRLQVREGFDGLNGRVDVLTRQVRATNGRVGSLETAKAVQAQQMTNIEHEMFSPLKRPVTRGDVYIFGLAVGVVAAAVKWLPALFAAARVAP